ncbi:MAG: large-conductance mechanosensitive channel [Dehalococcoidia bacterium]|nr:MAG: large-conductance mechanosensitive channel [Dehalococcoidia bacterium]
MIKGFRDFILRGNVVDLAVAVIIGTAFTAIVNSLVADIITPFLGIFGGIPDFSAWSFTVNGSRFAIGSFLNAVISFLVMAAVVYFFIVLPTNRAMERFKPEPPSPAPTRDCPECLSKIPAAARRCAFCSAEVTPAAVEPV